MKTIITFFETTGRAFGWMFTMTSALAALAALLVALNNRDIAEANLRYQRINASLQFGTNLFRDLDNASARYGDECMGWVASYDRPAIAAWVRSGQLDEATADDQGARCLAGVDGTANPGARSHFVSRQIYNRLNSMFLPLQALNSGVFDRAIICDDILGIVDSPATRSFFETVAAGTAIERDYAPIAAFLKAPTCKAEP